MILIEVQCKGSYSNVELLVMMNPDTYSTNPMCINRKSRQNGWVLNIRGRLLECGHLQCIRGFTVFWFQCSCRTSNGEETGNKMWYCGKSEESKMAWYGLHGVTSLNLLTDKMLVSIYIMLICNTN